MGVRQHEGGSRSVGGLTLGSGGTRDHYILIYNPRKVNIVLGPLHFGPAERPLVRNQVLFSRHKKGGVTGPVAGHRGSVGWLLSAVPYHSASSLVWAMGVHTSPSGATNKIPAQIHEIVTHAAKLRHDNIPVVLAGDWYMQKDAPGYASSLQQSGWQIIAPKYGTSLKHKNEDHTIQVADHFLVSDACEVDRLWQLVPSDTKGAVSELRFPPFSVEALISNANLVTNADNFVRISTPTHLWQQLGAWLTLKVDHTPVFARFTVHFDGGRVVEVPRNLETTITEWNFQLQPSSPTPPKLFSLSGTCPQCSGQLQPILSGNEQVPGEFSCPTCNVGVTVPGGKRVPTFFF